ncbi:hypothetical protein F220043C3_41430 [Enterocloster asparagiformis]|uniref:LysR family transcriptional regulator n=1 Tax=Enterocloster asparagiformis TaxID=333367 RepID=UPI0034BABCF6
MTIEDMKYIITVINEGSINKAAQRLFISQPALSQLIKKVEAEYDITLFLRIAGGRSLQLTEEGELFLNLAKDIIARHKCFIEELQELKEEENQTIKLGLTPRMAPIITPLLLDWFQMKHPNYFVEVRENFSSQLEKEVEIGSLDLAYLSLDTTKKYNLETREVGTYNWYIYLRKGSPAANLAVNTPYIPFPVLPLTALADEIIAVSKSNHRGADLIDAIEEKADISFKRKIIENPLNRRQLAENGLCTSFITFANDIKYDRSLIYSIAPNDNIPIVKVICYRSELRKSKKIQIAYDGLCFAHHMVLSSIK